MRISDGSSDVCSSDLVVVDAHDRGQLERAVDGAERLGGGHGAPAGSDGVSDTLTGSRGQAICEPSWPRPPPSGASAVWTSLLWSPGRPTRSAQWARSICKHAEALLYFTISVSL